MPATCKRDGFQEDMSLYAETWEYAVMALALDHFYREVVEGNVPLNGDQPWWEQRIVAERVGRYAEPWCLLFEGLSSLRSRLESQVPYSVVEIDQNLRFTYTGRRRRDSDAAEPITWEREGA
jgi:hypothetical protein